MCLVVLASAVLAASVQTLETPNAASVTIKLSENAFSAKTPAIVTITLDQPSDKPVEIEFSFFGSPSLAAFVVTPLVDNVLSIPAGTTVTHLTVQTTAKVGFLDVFVVDVPPSITLLSQEHFTVHVGPQPELESPPLRRVEAKTDADVAARSLQHDRASGSDQVLCWGSEANGELGRGDSSDSYNYVPPGAPLWSNGDAPAGIVSLVGGGASSRFAVITDDGNAFLWGDRSTPSPLVWNDSPFPVGGLASMALGDGFKLGLGANGALYTWGAGICATQAFQYPHQITTGNVFVMVGAAQATGFAIDTAGKAYACGRDDGGVGGNGDLPWGDGLNPLDLDPSLSVVSIAGGFQHAMLAANNKAYNWGCGPAGGVDDPNWQLGQCASFISSPQEAAFGAAGFACAPLPPSGISSVHASLDASWAISNAGELYGWGANTIFRKFGVATDLAGHPLALSPCPIHVAFPADAAPITSVASQMQSVSALDANGVIYSWGYEFYYSDGSRRSENSLSSFPLPIVQFSKTATAIAHSYLATCAVFSDMDLPSPTPSPSKVGNYQDLLCFGYNSDGADAPAEVPWLVGAPVRGMSKVVSNTVAGHNGILTGTGDVFMWGLAQNGELGTDDWWYPSALHPLPIKWGLNGVQRPAGGIVDLALGNGFTVAVGAGGEAYGWGDNSKYQLCSQQYFLSPMIQRIQTTVSVAHVGAGAYSSYFIDTNGVGYACGNNAHGQLGVGPASNTNYATMTAMAPIPAPIDVIVGGGTFSLMLGGGKVYDWGQGDAAGNSATGTPSEALWGDGSVCAAFPQSVTAIAAGNGHAMALGADTVVYTWGDNSAGQLGITGVASSACPRAVSWPGGVPQVTLIAAAAQFSVAVAGDVVYVWGSTHASPVLVSGVPPEHVYSITARDGLACFLVEADVPYGSAAPSPSSTPASPPSVSPTPTPTSSASATATSSPSLSATTSTTPAPSSSPATISVTAGPANLATGDTSSVTVTLSHAVSTAVVVTLEPAGTAVRGVDYTVTQSPMVLTIPAGSLSVSVGITCITPNALTHLNIYVNPTATGAAFASGATMFFGFNLASADSSSRSPTVTPTRSISPSTTETSSPSWSTTETASHSFTPSASRSRTPTVSRTPTRSRSATASPSHP